MISWRKPELRAAKQTAQCGIERLVIFDIDGTLHKTEVMSLAAHCALAKKTGRRPPSKEVLFRTYGEDPETILDILGITEKEEREVFFARIQEEEAKQMEACAVCYPGIEQLLERLHDDGISIALCSMCDQPYMDAFVRRFHLEERIAYGRSAKWGTDKRLVLKGLLENAGARRAVMVGDRRFDMEAARFCGIPFIGCLFGYAPEEITAAEYKVEYPDELYDRILPLLSLEA